MCDVHDCNQLIFQRVSYDKELFNEQEDVVIIEFGVCEYHLNILRANNAFRLN